MHMLNIFVLSLLFIISSSSAQNATNNSPTQSCSVHAFPHTTFASCQDLPTLTSFLYWNYEPSTRVVQLAFRHIHIKAPTWIAWAINPTSTGMIGAQSLVAFQRDDGTVEAYTSPITTYGTRLEPGNLSFPVFNISATYAGDEMVLYATLELSLNTTLVNHVWQTGPVAHNTPAMHSLSGPNVQSSATLDFLSGKTDPTISRTSSVTKLKYVHGILNAIGWGILMPIGVIMARYLKVMKPEHSLWFKLHRNCQCFAYLLGVSGAITGVVLGTKSKGVQYTAHKYIGILLFLFATLQVLSLKLRPQKDHIYRIYWTIYHMSIGYSTLILSIYNIIGGLHILQVSSQWRIAYIGVLSALGSIALLLEIYTCYLVRRQPKAPIREQSMV